MAELEQQVARFCGRRYAVGVSSGTDALFLGLKALNIGPGDEVITTSLSWIATANAIMMAGATPVFADIDGTLNIDPDSVTTLVSERTKAILPVHYTGRIADMGRLGEIARQYNLMLVEDAAQAFGAERDGVRAGAFGDLACFSMNSMKIFASCGEAGMVLTDDAEVHERLLALRYNGTINKEVCIEPGLNARMHTLQAAILLERLKRVSAIIRRRREIAAAYNERLQGVVGVPAENAGEYHVYYSYTIQADRRDELKEYLAAHGIETKIWHPILMPEQPAYREQPRARIVNARRLVQKILCLPSHEKMSDGEVEFVIDRVRTFYRR